MKINEREICYDILNQWSLDETLFSDILETSLRKVQFEEKSVRAFVTRLSTGVVERKITLDRAIRLFSTTKFEKIKPEVLTILRMGIYQILFMDSVPDRAAIFESVELAKAHHFNGLAGFMNAVLRAVSRDVQEGQLAKLCEENPSVKYSVPKWLVDLLVETFGKDLAFTILEDQFVNHATSIRVNRSRSTVEEVKEILNARGVKVEEGSYSKQALKISQYDFIRRLSGFAEGFFTVQDESSMMAVEAIGIQPGDLVFDLCAAPGGKTTYAAELTGPEGRVISRDVSKDKTDLIRENVERLILPNVVMEERSALDPDTENYDKADVVICDVPCSGLGVMSRKTDIKYHVKKDSAKVLSQQGLEILKKGASLVKKGGKLLFSTCTILPEENQENRERFMNWANEIGMPFELVDEKQYIQGRDNCDGFYYAVMRKL